MVRSVPWHRALGRAGLFLLLANATSRASDDGVAFFEMRIRPVLVEHCYKCHSGMAKKTKGGLRLDLRETLRRGGDSGPAIVPGRPDASLLIKALRYESLEMPPKGQLPERVIADFVRWIAMGAPDPRDGKSARGETDPAGGRDHWAFQPVRDSERPSVVDESWSLSDVDYYILSRLERAGLGPAPDADRYTWLRRVSFDLTGLPPTVEEIRGFQGDSSPLAFENVVDRLLASRAFGERWARHWLDLVGYADQIGTSNNVFSEHGWRYRDYLIDAFNRDKPFDRFIREQLAGDLLPWETPEERAASLTATGFLLLGDLEIVEADKAKLRVDIVDQQVVKTSKAFLAMTVGCARCHDHKFDPVPQRDYYALAGFFDGMESVYKTKRGVWSDVTTVELPETEAQRAERAERARRHDEKLTALKAERDAAAKRRAEIIELLKRTDDKTTTADGAGDGAPDAAQRRAELTKERDALGGRIGGLNRQIEHSEFFAPRAPRAYGARDRERPGAMRITIRGNPRALGDEVPRGFLSVVTTETPTVPAAESGRRQLADWIASAKNPLTARAAVNRIWQKLFGTGLVRSVDYFGVRGEVPSHPELLDHLAHRFVEDGWSWKRLIRRLVLSRVYRMSSAHSDSAHEVDPDNRLLWRMNRRRLGAEALRDAMLAVSRKLQPSAGGPAIPLEYLENVGGIDPANVNPPSFSLRRWRPEQKYQRTIYLPVIRSGAQPGPAELRNVFDFTQPAVFAGERSVTAVPTQALFLMNSPAAKAQAEDLAERVKKGAPDDAARLELLWLCALNRPITTDERRDAQAFLDASSGDGVDGWTELSHAVLASNEFLMRL